jgi:phage-related baseplate assembly protein
MTASLDSLTTPLTREEVQASIYEVLATIGVNTTGWKPGAVVRTIIVGVSAVLSALSILQSKIARSGFLELSEGDWLTLVAHYVYGVDRIDATFGTGVITLTNSGGGVYSFAIGDLIFTNPDTGKTYRNTAAVDLAALSSATVAIRAEEAGSGSTSAATAISQLVTTVIGVSCSNAAAVIGQDAESDSALRLRCYDKLGALSPMGPSDAYGFAARSAKRQDGTTVGITRVRSNKDGLGNVFVYVANASGPVTGTVGDLSTDLGAVDEAIQQNAPPLAVTAYVASATGVPFAVTYEVWMYNTSGRTPAQVQALISARLAAFTAAQAIGGNYIDPGPGKIFLDAIQTVIEGTLPEIFRAVLSLPAADVSLTSSQVATLGTVTCAAIHQVAPEGSI